MPRTAGPGKVTLKDIAELADVSIAAVSKALSGDPQIGEQTRQRVRQISKRLNYQPRRRVGFRKVGSRRLALLVVGTRRAPAYLMPMVDQVKQLSTLDQSISLEITTLKDADDPQSQKLLAHLADTVDGLLMDGAVTEALFRRASALSVPCVMLGNVGGDPLTQYDIGFNITVDIRAMGCAATRRLLESGRRRIAYIGLRHRSNFWFDQWLQGYRHAHAEAGVPVDLSRVIVMTGDGDFGAKAAGQVCRSAEPPDGYVIPDSFFAAQFVSAMQLRGRPLLPHDMVYGVSFGQPERSTLAPFHGLFADNVRMSKLALNIMCLAMNGQLQAPVKVLVPFVEVAAQDDATAT